MAGLRPSGLPRSGLVQRRFSQISQDLFVGEFSSITGSLRLSCDWSSKYGRLSCFKNYSQRTKNP